MKYNILSYIDNRYNSNIYMLYVFISNTLNVGGFIGGETMEVMDILQFILKTVKILAYLIPIAMGIGGIHIFFYSRSPRYYFKVAKFFSKWRDTNWQLTATYNINRQIEFYSPFEMILKNRYGTYRKTFNLKNKKLYEFGNFTLTVQYDLDISPSDTVPVELLFSNVNVTYKNAEKMLKDLRMLFNELEKQITIVDKRYNLNVKFNSIRNPFFGLMIQRLGEEHIHYFECVFPLSLLLNKNTDDCSKENYTLCVYKEYITINEADFDSVEDIAKKCLLMG